MGKKRREPLTIDQLYDAYHAAIQQARDLVAEAELLQQAGRLSGTLHRSVIALEEVGKARIVFYQGAMIVGGLSSDWQRFWKSYYSHVDKLEEVMLWLDLYFGPEYENPADVEAAYRILRGRASELDIAKQSSSYSRPEEGSFRPSSDADAQADGVLVFELAQEALRLIEANSLTKASRSEFSEHLEVKVKYFHALGYAKAKTKEEFYQVAVDMKGRLLPTRGALPTDKEFMDRVKERYSYLPPLLPVTLPQLRASDEFRAFYGRLRDVFGYPDWVILSVVYNLALNHRIDTAKNASEDDIVKLNGWREDPEVDDPLDIAVFMTDETFELMLDLWMFSFLDGLGVVPELPDGRVSPRIRRIAAVHFSVFDRDVAHEPIFGSEATDDSVTLQTGQGDAS
jgi:AbiV family abortive infection protein